MSEIIMNSKMAFKDKIQARMSSFGSAMLGAVLLFPFLAMVISISIILQSIFTDGFVHDLLSMAETAGWTVFNNMALLFAVGIPIKLAKKANAHACLVSLLTYMIFNTILGFMANTWGLTFGVDFQQEVGGTSGLAVISGIKTLDTSIIGGIVVGSIVTWIHNRFYDKTLPEYLGIFQGPAYISILCFGIMFPLAFIFMIIWPHIQAGMVSLQQIILTSGNFGVWLYIFLEKILLPTGLHHFIYSPFQYADVAVQGGTMKYWLQHMEEFRQSTLPLKDLFPMGGYTMQGNGAVFGGLGMAAAIYHCAKPENKAKVAGIIVPAALTSMFIGITEPLDFTFLFIAPVLFAMHAVLSATMTTIMYYLGVVGNFGSGLLEWATQNWIPMFNNHSEIMIKQIIVGLVFSFIYFIVFRFFILKFNIKTLGRGEGEYKLYNKSDLKNKKSDDSLAQDDSAENYLHALGGKSNILDISHCLTRVRLVVKDPSLVKDDDEFKSIGAMGLIKNNTNIQVVVGPSKVMNAYEQLTKLVRS